MKIFITSIAWIIISLITGCAQPSPTAEPAEQSADKATDERASCAPKQSDYPEESFRRGHEGTTRLRFIIDETGKPTAIKVIRTSGHTDLDKKSIEILSRCVLRPYTDPNGNVLRSQMDVDYKWSLR